MQKEQEIIKLQGYIATSQTVIASLTELQTALDKHTGKVVNKTFFEKYFTLTNEDGTPEKRLYTEEVRTKYCMYTSDFSWAPYRIYLTTSETLNLLNRDTAHIRETVSHMLTAKQLSITEYTNQITALNAFDEKALVSELLALYYKHGQPSIWQEILDQYEVKYPKQDVINPDDIPF